MGPVIPDASQDPFGAMNAMAAHGAAIARGPEIVIVNDGNVESVERSSKAVTYIKYGALVLAPLLLGVAMGQIGSSAKIFNKTIEDAGHIAEDVQTVGKGLQRLKDTLLIAKERGPGGNSFKVVDEDLTRELEELGLAAPETDGIYHSYMYEMDAILVKDILSFYVETTLLYQQVDGHIKAAKNEAKAIALANEELKRKNFTPTSFGVYVELPTEDEAAKGARPAAQFVELGLPLCADGKPSPQGCPPDQLRGFLYRPNANGPWGPMELATEAGAIPGKKLVLLQPTSALLALVKGGEATVAEVDYRARIRDIEAKLDDLMERRKSIQNKVAQIANRSKKFTFLM